MNHLSAILHSIVNENNRKYFDLLLFFIFSSFLNLYSKPRLELQSGHTGSVNCIKFASNSKYFATGSSDNSIKLWNKESGLLICTFRGHTNEITNLDFSLSGDTLFSSSQDKTVKVWDIRSTQLITTFTGSQTAVTDVSVHPFNRIVLTSGLDEIKIWDINTSRTIEKWSMAKEIEAVEYSPNGEFLAFSDKANNINIKLTKSKSSETGIVLLQGHKNSIRDICFNKEGTLLATSDRDNYIFVWDVKKNKLINKFKGFSNKISFSKDDKNLIATTDSSLNNIIIYDISGKIIKNINTSSDDLICFDFSPDGNFLVTGNISGQIEQWDMRTSNSLFKIVSLRNPVKGILYSNITKNIITANSDSYIKFWDLEYFQQPKFIKSNLSNIANIRLSYDGSLMIVAGLGFNENVEIYNVLEKTLIKKLKIETDIIHQCGLSNDNKLFYLIDNFSIKLFDIEKDSIVSVFPSNPRAKAIFHPKYNLLFMHINDELKCFDITKGNIKYSRKINLFDPIELLFSCTEDTLFSIGAKSELIAMEIDNGAITYTPDYDKNNTRHLSCLTLCCRKGTIPEQKIAVGLENNTISIQSGFKEELMIKQAHSNSIDNCTFAQSDSFLISGSSDGLIKVWNLQQEGELFATLFTEKNNWVVISNTGHFDGSEDGFKKLHWVKDFECLPMETYYNNFYSSMLLSNLFNQFKSSDYDTIGKLISENNEKVGEILPPKLKILSPLYIDSTNLSKLNITIEAISGTNPISEIRIYYNEKLIRKDSLATPKKYTTLRDYPCYLFMGCNEFKVIAYDINKNESLPAIVKITQLSEEIKPNLYLVSLGISDYDNENKNLRYASADARAITQAYNEDWMREKVNVKTYQLYDKECTKKNLVKILKEISEKANYNDNFVFFFSGHGLSLNEEKEKYKNITQEFFLLLNNGNELSDTLLSASELENSIENIKASKQLIILDACHSSLACEKIKRDRLSKIARDAGFSLFFSSTSNKKAYEQELLGHGLFTYTILEGIKGKADNGDKKIMTLELQSYIGLKLPMLSKELIGKEQLPVLKTEGNDFILYYLMQ